MTVRLGAVTKRGHDAPCGRAFVSGVAWMRGSRRESTGGPWPAKGRRRGHQGRVGCVEAGDPDHVVLPVIGLVAVNSGGTFALIESHMAVTMAASTSVGERIGAPRRRTRTQLRGDRARLDAESRRVAAQTGLARFLAIQLGTDAETVIRWLVTFLVLLIDPSAVVLTVAAARRN
jgi:hypothetical protein